MSEITIDIKDEFHIVEDGHHYALPCYTIGNEGLEEIDDVVDIKLVRGTIEEDGEVNHHDGTLIEHILHVLIHDLKKKKEEVPSRETSLAITKLEEARNFLLQRQIDRKKRKVLNTRKD